MSNLYNRILALCEQRGITGYRLCKDVGIQPSILTDLKMGRKDEISAKTAGKIATYFDVSIGYVLGTEEPQGKEKSPAQKDEAKREEFIRLFEAAPAWLQDQVRNLLEAAEAGREAQDGDPKAR